MKPLAPKHSAGLLVSLSLSLGAAFPGAAMAQTPPSTATAGDAAVAPAPAAPPFGRRLRKILSADKKSPTFGTASGREKLGSG